MRTFSVIVLAFCFIIMATVGIMRQNRIHQLEKHIEYLEEYIQNNYLPTPAYTLP